MWPEQGGYRNFRLQMWQQPTRTVTGPCPIQQHLGANNLKEKPKKSKIRQQKSKTGNKNLKAIR
jgi:hypothetical protein